MNTRHEAAAAAVAPSSPAAASAAELLARKLEAAIGPDGGCTIRAIDRVKSPYTVVHRIQATLNGQAQVWYAKRLAERGDDALSARRLVNEHAILVRLQQVFAGHPALGAVEPVARIDELYTLVTREAPGGTLEELIHPACRIYRPGPGARALTACERAGQWLAIFQQSTASGEGAFDAQEWLNYCSERTRALAAKQAPGVDRAWLAGFEESAAVLLAEVARRQWPLAGRHNDYAPHNIIERDGRLSVLDFTMYNQGATYYDVCNFWTKLERMKRDLRIGAHNVSLLQRAFLRGYGGDDALRQPLFTLIRMRTSLVRLLQLRYQQERGPRLMRPLLAREYAREFRELGRLCARRPSGASASR